jgi:hypothetical protein
MTDRKEEGTWDGRRREGGTNSTLRIKEQDKRLTLNEHDDGDDDDVDEFASNALGYHIECK